MKLLKVEKPHGYFLKEDGSYGLIKDIDEDGVFYLAGVCLNEEKVEIDPSPLEGDCPNPAEREIYDELEKQFNKLILEKATILKGIDDLFEDAEELYLAEEPVEVPEEWASEGR